jgi:hypothetical protein
MDSVDLEDDPEVVARVKGPPPVQPPGTGSGAGPARQTQPSMSVEQAAKPKFDITVGDPHKVGDLTSSHIVYQVRTKVGCIKRCCGGITANVVSDVVEGVSKSRVRCQSEIQRLSMALQFLTWEQSGCGCAAST